MLVVAHNGARIWGGAERATVKLLRGLEDRGHRVILLCNSQVVADRAQQIGVDSRISVIGGDITIQHAFHLARTLRELQPDAFIVGTYKKLFLATLGARLAGVPRVVARVGLESDTPRSLKYRYALIHWTHAVAVNAARMRSAFLQLPGWQHDQVKVIHNGVMAPPSSAPLGALRAELGIPGDAIVVGTIARLAKQKRIDRFLDALALLPGNVFGVIAGDGPRRDDLLERISQLGIGDRVRLLGERTDIGDVLQELDVFIVSSDSEGLSNAMLEALATGVPVVSTNVSGAEDALTDPEVGASGVITDFSAQAIATAITDLLNDRQRLQRFAANARKVAVERFSFEKMLDEWEAFLSAR